MSFTAISKGRFLFDIFITAAASPTGKPLRMRVKRHCPADKAKSLDAEITAALSVHGAWDPANSAVLKSISVAADVSLETETSLSQTPLVRKGTLRAALDLAWSDSEEGWMHTKAGETQHRNARIVLAILGDQRTCGSITRDDYATVRTKLAERGNSEASVTRKLQAFYRLLYFAEREKWIKARPKFTRRKVNNARLFTFTPEVEKECIQYLRQTDGSGRIWLTGMHEIFIAGLDGGFRAGEIVGMIGANVRITWCERKGGEKVEKYPEATVLVPDEQAKNGQFRQVFVAERFAWILHRRIREHGKGILFPGWSVDAIGKRMQNARMVIDPDNKEFVFHATRHTHITRWAERGLELAALMEQAGHKTPSMTMRYIHMAAEKRKQQMRRLIEIEAQEARAA